MPRPLTITSTTNAHALWAYASLVALGGHSTFTQPPKALVAASNADIATFLMGALMFGGIACFSAALVSSRRRDPTMGLSVEIGTLVFLALILLAFLTSLFKFYGYDAPSLTILVGANLGGCISRLIQAAYERRLLTRARRQRDRRTVEVTAEPDRE